ncbi:uncharacterized protein PHALS_14904 [Plasmopara halstedii]|uniref:Uncharacterized protein n=1 Tax=Plasmopara halstedii TaxID=4781 RepID=A0A0P1A7I9_PLAHL|nr:uncharacterized protein PHALS_14904 [Plasmopara halstedii]CEG36462.1 hypothetical protein PHALS_14904 [Plasmopara halstedii]|eukprot:XP_024572831.1 hypothetical protein PHALS_14904 [Plasmopara halstedii]
MAHLDVVSVTVIGKDTVKLLPKEDASFLFHLFTNNASIRMCCDFPCDFDGAHLIESLSSQSCRFSSNTVHDYGKEVAGGFTMIVTKKQEARAAIVVILSDFQLVTTTIAMSTWTTLDSFRWTQTWQMSYSLERICAI